MTTKLIKETTDSYICLIDLKDNTYRLCTFLKINCKSKDNNKTEQKCYLKSYIKLNEMGIPILHMMGIIDSDQNISLIQRKGQIQPYFKYKTLILGNDQIKRIINLKGGISVMDDFLEIGDRQFYALDNGESLDLSDRIGEINTYIKKYLEQKRKFIERKNFAEIFIPYPSNDDIREILAINEMTPKIIESISNALEEENKRVLKKHK